MIRYRAAWVLPIDGPPIRDGCVTVDGDRIVALGGGSAGAASGPAFAGPPVGPPEGGPHDDNGGEIAAAWGPALAGPTEIDLGEVVVLPGLVNAHTHLELSYLRDEVPPAPAFVTWVRGVMAARRRRPDPKSPEILDAIDRALEEAVACGTAMVGDISNTLVTFDPIAKGPLAAIVFYELIRFNAPDAQGVVDQAVRDLGALEPTAKVRASLAAHAPYSVAPMVLRAIRRAVDGAPSNPPCSVHLSESAEETQFIRTGRGPWRELLEEVGAWDASWVPSGGTPVVYLDDHGFLDSRVLAVHGVQMTNDDLTLLAARGTTLVTCPRSNRYTGAGAPPVDAFYASGVNVAVGTDSLASAPDLNVFEELAALRRLAPSVPAATLLHSATRQGARALGFADYGTIASGQRARLIAVDVPRGLDDVEEYLVNGIRREQIRWLTKSEV